MYVLNRIWITVEKAAETRRSQVKKKELKQNKQNWESHSTLWVGHCCESEVAKVEYRVDFILYP